MENLVENKQLIKINTNENGEQLVSGRDLYNFLEIKDNFTDWIKRMIEYGFIESIDFTVLSEKSDKLGRPSSNYILKVSMAKEISMIQRNEKGKQARLYFIECEKKLNQIRLPQTFGEALLEAGRLAIENERLAQERDIAIKTKAQISDKKTATVLGKLGGMTKACNKYREQVGFSKTYATTKKVEIITKKKYSWKALKEFSIANDIEIIKVPDINYGTVSAYHAKAWQSVYDIDLSQLVESDNT